jgi:hypothetical protein
MSARAAKERMHDLLVDGRKEFDQKFAFELEPTCPSLGAFLELIELHVE